MNIQRLLFSLKPHRFTRLTSCHFAQKSAWNAGDSNTPSNSPKETAKLVRNVSTLEVTNVQKEAGFVSKISTLFGFKKTRLTAIGYDLYQEIADNVNYIDFFEELALPDTFYSWFVVTELHIWMLTVRAMAEGDDGKHVRNGMVEALWTDVAQRVKQLGAANPSDMRTQISNLSEQLQAALIAYDEGLQSDDIVLSGALWRRLYQYNDVDVEHLELLVKYVRKHVTLLENVSTETLFKHRKVEWNPVKS